MDYKFKRSLIGYNPLKVLNEIEKEKKEFERIYNSYKNELTRLANENIKLKEERDILNSQMSGYKASRGKLEKLLYDMHINACMVVYNSDKKLNEMIKEKTNILKEQENKNQEIRQSINKLIEQVHLILED